MDIYVCIQDMILLTVPMFSQANESGGVRIARPWGRVAAQRNATQSGERGMLDNACPVIWPSHA